MNREEYTAKFNSVVEWFKAHPKAAAVIAATLVGVVLGYVLFH